MMHGLFRLFAIQVCIVAALCVANGARAASTFTGKVTASVTRPVLMPFNAIIDEVLVKGGDEVKKGSPLVRYHLPEETARILQREVTMGAGTEDLKGQILEMEQKLATTTAERNKARGLVGTGLGSKQALARLEESVDAYNGRIAILKESIAKNNANFNARLKELGYYFNEPIKAGEKLPSTLTLVSPLDGHVLFVDPDLNPGALFPANKAPVQVGQLNPMLIQIPVYESEISGIQPGDKATVEIPALGNRKFTGSVNEISWTSTDMNVANPSYYNVELVVPNPDLLLKPGFKAVVQF